MKKSKPHLSRGVGVDADELGECCGSICFHWVYIRSVYNIFVTVQIKLRLTGIDSKN